MFLWLALLLALPGLALAQTTRFVKPTGTGDGSAWGNASGDLQAMITASASGDQVWVATGTYYPGGQTNTDRSISFAMKDGVSIYGGFAGTEGTLLDRTLTYPSSSTLSGDIDNDGTLANNSYQIIRNSIALSNSAILDGFVVTGGNAYGGDYFTQIGGAVLNDGSNRTCSPTFRDCSFTNNASQSNGGGVYNYAAGGNSSPVFINCGFRNNTTQGGQGGGGLFNDGNNGGTVSSTLINCVFENNTAGNGAAISNYAGATPMLTNCTFANNTSSAGAGVLYVETNNGNSSFTNCVFWNNGSSLFAGPATVQYSLLPIGATGFTDGGNNQTTPISPFVSATDLQLNNCATGAINTGNSLAAGLAGITKDAAGQDRVFSAVDMGAFELQSVPTPGPTRLYVNAGASATGQTGLDWTNTFTDLQSALSYTGCTGNLTEIWVAGGTYKPTTSPNRNISFAMLPGVAIYGGFNGGETTLGARPPITLTTPSGTTLSGDIGTLGDNADNSYHVILNPTGLTTTALLDGFVITGGNANGFGILYEGGGMRNEGSSPTIRNCAFLDNSAGNGGAMFNNGVSGNSSPIITNCLFQNNRGTPRTNSRASAGAVYNNSYRGISSPVFTNCAFVGNTASDYAGAIYNEGSGTSSPTLTNCSFLNNTSGSGGAIFSDADGAGAISNPTLTNCVFFGNGGTDTFVTSNSATLTATYSLFDASVTGFTDGGNNLTTSVSPFVSATDLRLNANAPAINAGNNAAYESANGPATDLAGNVRIKGLAIDMGALEVQNVPDPPTWLYVNAAQTTVSGDGLTWATAFPTLEQATTFPFSRSLTEIFVAGGTYTPAATLSMLNNVGIYGGFTGNETALNGRVLTYPLRTTISGGGNKRVFNNRNLDNTAILDGFVITGGNFNDAGGGMNNRDSSPTIRNCAFQGNSAESGGGINNDGGSPTLINCTFQGNSATQRGGAIYNANGSPTLVNCSLLGNSSRNNDGGAMYSSNGNPILTNCVFFSNQDGDTFTGNAPNATYCLFDASVTGYTGSNNLTTTVSPFVSATDLHLNGCALAINTGSNAAFTAATSLTTDLGGQPRFYANGQIDMGAFEFQGVGNGPINITAQPDASSVLCGAGQPVSVSVGVSGAISGYQWYKNGVSLGAAQRSATLTFPSAQFSDSGSYSLVVTSTNCGSLTSTAFELTVQPAPTRLYVKASATTGANTGADWANAFTDLQSALKYTGCITNLTEIWVASGTYKPTTSTNRNISFAMLPGVAIYGGFAGGEISLTGRVLTTPSSTTLSGDVNNDGTTNGNTAHLFNNPAGLTNTAVLDGFVLTGGSTNDNGGGMINVNSSPTIRNCWFESNRASRGGAIDNTESSNPLLVNCVFARNRASEGGAIYNRASDPTLINTIFRLNSSSNGGALFNDTSNPGLTNCLFQGNSAFTNGGAVHNTYGSNPILTNCSFQSNSAVTSGGAVYDTYGSSPIMTNCVLFGNGGNTFIGETSISYSLFDASVTGYTDGGNNLTTNVSPFVSATDLRLNANAPAINAGNSSATGLTGITTDLGGNPRIFGSAVDMGAFEFQGAANSPVVITAQPAGSSVLCGTGQTVTVSGGATGTISGYQWYKDAVSLGTAQQAPTLTLTGVTTASSGNYALVIIGGCGNVSTTDFRLTVNPLPVVSVVNSGSSSCVGVASLSVVSAPAGYQINWLNGGNLAFAGLPQSITAGVTVAGGNGNGNGANQLGYPSGVFVDATGAVYIVDNNNHRVQKWAVGATAGITVAGGNGSGSAANQLKEPYGGLHVDGDGAVYVVDNSNHRIQKWAVGATAGTTVAGGNGPGSAANQLNRPNGVYVDAAGAVYVADRLNSRVQKWAAGATSGITVAGGNGRGTNPNQLSRPSGVFVDGAGAVYIADQSVGVHRVQKWAAGATVGTTVAGGNGSGSAANQFDDPTGVYVDAFGAVYVSDYNHRIQKWAVGATSGTTVAGDAAGIRGNTADKLRDPEGVFVDRDGAIYVSDGSNDRIQKWAAPSASPVYSPTVAGSYTVRVTTAAGCSALSTNAVVVSTPVSITAQPVASSMVCAGGTVTASVSVSGTASGFQWYKTGPSGVPVAVSGQSTSALSLTNVQAGDSGSYSVVVSGCSSITSTAFSLTVNPGVTAQISPNATTICPDTSTTLTASGAGTGATYAWSNGSSLSAIVVSPTSTTAYSVTVTTSAGCSGVASATVTVSAALTASISAVGGPGKLTICNGSSATLTAGGGSSFAWSNETITQAIVVSPASTTAYQVTVSSGICSATTSATVTVKPALVITSQPASGSTVIVGANVTTSVSVSGTGPFTFQWLKNGVALSPAQTTSVLTLNSVQTTDSGNYQVAIGSSCGSLTSTAFTLNVGLPLGIASQPPASSVVCGGANVSASVSVTGTVSGYQWYKDGTSMGAAQRSATLSLFNVQPADAGSYLVVASSGMSSVTSTAFMLTVNAQPTVTVFVNNATVSVSGTMPVITYNPGTVGSFQVQGGVLYERLVVVDRINGYEIRQTETNQTGVFRIERSGPYTITVTGANGCKRTVEGQVVRP